MNKKSKRSDQRSGVTIRGGPKGFCSCSCLSLAGKNSSILGPTLLATPFTVYREFTQPLCTSAVICCACGIEPVLPAERVGGVGDDGVAGARPQVLQVEGGQGARDVVGEQTAEAAPSRLLLLLLLLVDLQVEAGRVPTVEPRRAHKEELL